MRRWAAILLLCLAFFYLGATSPDPCAESVNSDCATVCHLFCNDGCSTAPMPVPPIPPPPDALPGPVFEEFFVRPVLNATPEPETAPPRA